MMSVLADGVSSEPIVKSWSLIIALTICRPTDRPNYFEKPLADPEASVKHSGKEVGQVLSFRLRARSESRSELEAWYHSEGELRSIYPEEHSEATVQSSALEMHSSEAVQSESFVTR